MGLFNYKSTYNWSKRGSSTNQQFVLLNKLAVYKKKIYVTEGDINSFLTRTVVHNVALSE